MPFAKRGDVVHSEATSGLNNQKKSLLINGLAALGDSLRPLQQPLNGPHPDRFSTASPQFTRFPTPYGKITGLSFLYR